MTRFPVKMRKSGALKKEIEGYKDTTKKTEEAQATAEAGQSQVTRHCSPYMNNSKTSGYNKESLAKELKAVKKDYLGDTGIAVYDKIYDEYVSPLLCEEISPCTEKL